MNLCKVVHVSNSLEKIPMLGNIEGKRRRGRERMIWLDIIIDSLNMNLSKLQELMEDSGAWQVTVHRVAKSRTGQKQLCKHTNKQDTQWLLKIFLIIKSLGGYFWKESNEIKVKVSFISSIINDINSNIFLG